MPATSTETATLAQTTPETPRSDQDTPPPASWPRILLFAAIGLIALLGALFEVFGGSQTVHDLLSFKIIGLNYGVLKQYVEQHYWLAAALFIGCYGLLGFLLLPGSSLFVVGSGLLFGAMVGIPLATVGSVLAASLAFCTAKFALGGAVARLKHPAIETLRAGFQRHALSYMMFLRLTPGLPFAVLNAAPALIGVRFSTFLIGTIVGVLPSRIALSTAGAGLAKVIDIENSNYYQCVAGRAADGPACAYNIHVASLLTAETIAAFFALALMALMPALIDFGQRLRSRGTGTKTKSDY